MRETIATEVVVPDADDSKLLQIIRDTGKDDSDTVEFWLDGKKLFTADWSYNIEQIINRMQEIWKSPPEEEQK